MTARLPIKKEVDIPIQEPNPKPRVIEVDKDIEPQKVPAKISS